MAIYTNLPVYKLTYRLLLSINELMPGLSRDCRYSIGQDMRRRIMDIIIFIYRANRTRIKAPIISKMREALLEVQVYCRLLCDMRYVSEGRYLMLSEQIVEISKQMASWEKKEIEKSNGGYNQLVRADECRNDSD